MMDVTLSTLSVGNLYKKYTLFLVKRLDLLKVNINICITTDVEFEEDINLNYIKCHFYFLDKDIVKKTDKSRETNKTTCFKYYFKSYAIKNTLEKFPESSICHIDCDILPNSKFSYERFAALNKVNTLYCSNTVGSSGDYGEPQLINGELNIKPKFKDIMEKFLPNFNDYQNVRCPIENILFLNKVPRDKAINFCEDWLKIGSFVDEKGHPTYGDCFEIKPSCMMNNINIEQTNLLPFCDCFKWKFIELIKEKRNLFKNDNDFLDHIINEKLI